MRNTFTIHTVTMDLSVLRSYPQLIVLDAPVSMRTVPQSPTPKQHLKSLPTTFALPSRPLLLSLPGINRNKDYQLSGC